VTVAAKAIIVAIKARRKNWRVSCDMMWNFPTQALK
jgi:hypothetical protein